MSRSDAKDWMREQVDTEEGPFGESMAYTHPEGYCSICDTEHEGQMTEHVDLDTVYDHHGEAMENATEKDASIPDKAAENVKEALLKDAENQGTGHERFFEQA